MKTRLEKQNKIHLHFVELRVEDCLFKKCDGKNGVHSSQSSTRCCSTAEEAISFFEIEKQAYLQKKYHEVEFHPVEDDFSGIFDQAKWHFGGDFPSELPEFQGYVHTGFFIAWLIEHKLFAWNDELISSRIKKVIDREITGAEFYQDYLDGTFSTDLLTPEGAEFAFAYYHKGSFTEDYTNALGENFDSLYSIKDTWTNYEKLKPIINRRFLEHQKKPSLMLKAKNWFQHVLKSNKDD